MSFHQKCEYSLDLPICVLSGFSFFYFIFSTLKIILIKYTNHCGISTHTIITLSLFSVFVVVVLTVVIMSGLSMAES